METIIETFVSKGVRANPDSKVLTKTLLEAFYNFNKGKTEGRNRLYARIRKIEAVKKNSTHFIGIEFTNSEIRFPVEATWSNFRKERIAFYNSPASIATPENPAPWLTHKFKYNNPGGKRRKSNKSTTRLAIASYNARPATATSDTPKTKMHELIEPSSAYVIDRAISEIKKKRAHVESPEEETNWRNHYTRKSALDKIFDLTRA
jgi:hypothetical protein